jgi:hypothetical protein
MSRLPNIGTRFVLAAAVLLSGGCASIVSGRKATVAIDSYPSNAHVVVHDKTGREVASVNTPGVVSLNRNGRWFLPAHYTATIEAPGYQTAEVPIRSTINPWILGNVVVGGVPGLIVDDATGACWKPQQDSIHQQLTPMSYAQQPPAPTNLFATPPGVPTPAPTAVQTAMIDSAQQPPAPAGIAPTSSTNLQPQNPAAPSVARSPASSTFYR